MDTLLICPACVNQLETTEMDSMLVAADDLRVFSSGEHMCFVMRLQTRK